MLSLYKISKSCFYHTADEQYQIVQKRLALAPTRNFYLCIGTCTYYFSFFIDHTTKQTSWIDPRTTQVRPQYDPLLTRAIITAIPGQGLYVRVCILLGFPRVLHLPIPNQHYSINISLRFYQNLLSHLQKFFTPTGKRCLKNLF